jgi:hypothetical protein
VGSEEEEASISSFADLAREIISVTDDESSGPEGETARHSREPADANHEAHAEASLEQASFDLVLRPPSKGRLRRSKPPISKDRFLEADGLLPKGEFGVKGTPEHIATEAPEHESTGKPRGFSRLRHR